MSEPLVSEFGEPQRQALRVGAGQILIITWHGFRSIVWQIASSHTPIVAVVTSRGRLLPNICGLGHAQRSTFENN